MSRTVRGEIILPESVQPGEAAQVIVQVEDVSRADAPSGVVGEQRFEHVRLTPRGVLPFAVEVPEDRINDRGSYSVRVHVDVSGSGEVEKGDLISTQSHPVLTRGHADQAAVPVRKV